MTDEPAISVVIATHGRASRLPKLVRALAAQDLASPYEVIFVDDASSDDTPEQLGRLSTESSVPIRSIRLEQNAGPATARNRGWRAARAPLVAFTDDDCTPQPGWLRALADELSDGEFVQGRTLPDPTQTSAMNAFSRSMSVGGENGFYETCNIGYRKDLLERLGGFDEGFPRAAGEDTDLAYRAIEAGARFRFADDALVFHDIVEQDAAAYLRNKLRWTGVVRTVRKNPQLRRVFLRGPVWLRAHALALFAFAAWIVAVVLRRPIGVAIGLGGTGLYVAHRRRAEPFPGAVPPRARDLPLLLLGDLVEVTVHLVTDARFCVRPPRDNRSASADWSNS